ncbi:hypothetical protein AUI06_08450 [archaeon 13_2_20CM_2_52_21]|nr:MAG: hypothetical protein AUI06_08450 [archaeon 13_2_20CM_2_52_21]
MFKGCVVCWPRNKKVRNTIGYPEYACGCRPTNRLLRNPARFQTKSTDLRQLKIKYYTNLTTALILLFAFAFIFLGIVLDLW